MYIFKYTDVSKQLDMTKRKEQFSSPEEYFKKALASGGLETIDIAIVGQLFGMGASEVKRRLDAFVKKHSREHMNTSQRIKQLYKESVLDGDDKADLVKKAHKHILNRVKKGFDEPRIQEIAYMLQEDEEGLTLDQAYEIAASAIRAYRSFISNKDSKRSEAMSTADKHKVIDIMKSASGLFDMDKPLKSAGFKTRSVSTNAGYALIVQKGSNKVVIGNKKMFEPGDPSDFEIRNLVMGDYSESFKKGDKVSTSGQGRTKSWGKISGTVVDVRGGKPIVKWDGTKFSTDEMDPKEIKKESFKEFNSIIMPSDKEADEFEDRLSKAKIEYTRGTRSFAFNKDSDFKKALRISDKMQLGEQIELGDETSEELEDTIPAPENNESVSNGPSDDEVNEMAWKMYGQHWNALGTDEQNAIYKKLGYPKLANNAAGADYAELQERIRKLSERVLGGEVDPDPETEQAAGKDFAQDRDGYKDKTYGSQREAVNMPALLKKQASRIDALVKSGEKEIRDEKDDPDYQAMKRKDIADWKKVQALARAGNVAGTVKAIDRINDTFPREQVSVALAKGSVGEDRKALKDLLNLR